MGNLGQPKHHIPCIQDSEGVQLYTKTGILTKGGVQFQRIDV